MYPRRELIRLAEKKASLRRGISLRRHECLAAAAQIAAPFGLLDRAVGIWHRLAPVARMVGLPFGFLIGRTVSPRLKFLRLALRWGPLLMRATGALTSAIQSHSMPRRLQRSPDF
ncbi:MAG: hypothetical protein ABIV50_00305 [Opitutus sp.]